MYKGKAGECLVPVDYKSAMSKVRFEVFKRPGLEKFLRELYEFADLYIYSHSSAEHLE